MSSNLNQTQQSFLQWLVETVRKEQFLEDNLIFTFTNSGIKLLDGTIQENVPEDLNLQRGTLDVLNREGYIYVNHRGTDSYQYTCSLTQKAYETVDSQFI
jgi:hypothetical protein